MMIRPVLLTHKEFCAYLNISRNKGYEILRSPYCIYSIRIGRRLYADKNKLDKCIADTPSLVGLCGRDVHGSKH